MLHSDTRGFPAGGKGSQRPEGPSSLTCPPPPASTVSTSLSSWVPECPLLSVPFHIEREAEFRHHLHSLLGVERSTSRLRAQPWPRQSSALGGLARVQGEQRASLHTWSLKSGGNCRRMGGSAGEQASQCRAPGPSPRSPLPPEATNSPSCREAGQAASKNQSNTAGGSPLWDRTHGTWAQ